LAKKRPFCLQTVELGWAGDITYRYTSEGWLYLSVIIDLYSRGVIGWPMAPHMKSSLVCDALKMAMFRRGFPKGVTVHSDRGSQYYSNVYRELLHDHQLKPSMRRKGNWWDNGVPRRHARRGNSSCSYAA
jgi:putative transposase